jgi:formylglycine-generating enzyme required for sulfatase activity
MRLVEAFACAMMLIWLGAVPAHAEKRVALVVGNDRYVNLPAHEQLLKAVNDAGAVGEALHGLGFEVIHGENLGRQALVDKLEELSRRLAPGDDAFFFFAGHGVMIGGGNYILPSDVPNVEPGQETRLTRAALGESDIVADLQQRGVRVAVVVLDACRDNPFKRPGVRSVGGERGLARIEPARGVFTLYSAGLGQTALDRLGAADSDPNSVFTRVLVPELAKPGIDLTQLAIDVREDVARLAASVGHDQRPAYYDETVGGRIYLAGLPGTPPTPVEHPANEVAQAWAAAKDTTSIAVLEDFIRRYRNSIYATTALARLEELKQVVAVVPPVPPRPADPCGALSVSLSARRATPLCESEERALRPKDAFKECDRCPEMVVVPAGLFMMGSPPSESGRRDNESPQHEVRIKESIAVGRFHVTVEQFAVFVAETNYDAGSNCRTFEDGKWAERQGRSWRNPGFPQEGSHPAVCVSWNDAELYLKWLARKTGQAYRLLTEPEWEYAARAQTKPTSYPRYWFGNAEMELCRFGNGADQTIKTGTGGVAGWSVAPCSDGYAFTSPVGHFPANGFGLYDMLGDAWQWTEDCYHDNYSGAPATGEAWMGTDCKSHVRRGGAWRDPPRDLRSAHRNGSASEVRDSGIGFRVARAIAVH